MKHLIHMDMDAFFASVEIASRPYLRRKPVAVGGSMNSRTVVAAASYKAREYGIKAGMPSYEAHSLCPDLIVVDPDMEKYSSVSADIFNYVKSYVGNLEIYSIDECFFFIDAEREFTEKLCMEIKAQIRNNFKITCSMGIGQNRLIAKIASDEDKPDGLTYVEDGKSYIRGKAVEDVPGIGRRMKKHLNAMGIYTVADLSLFPTEVLRHYFKSYAYVLKAISEGQDSSNTLWNLSNEIKSVGNTHTMRHDTSDRDELLSLLSILSDHVSMRMRKHTVEGNVVTLTVRYSDFTTFTRQKKIFRYIYTWDDIYAYSSAIFSEIDRIMPVRLLGISVSNLHIMGEQMSLDFDSDIDKRADALDKAVSEIKDRFGEWSIMKCRGMAVSGKNFQHFGGIDRRVQ